MANAKIDIIGEHELSLVAELYNQVFKPTQDLAFIQRRMLGRYNPCVMVAQVEGRPAGFFIGFELKPGVYFAWLYGVLPDYRRQGIASQLVEAAQEWAKAHGYTSIRMECHNQHRPMLHLAIRHGYDIVGIRWDPARADNLVILEKLHD